uniref:Uncharacterized protein n=1 Tax=Lotus japonicus TaxID=34305 RepID=I3SHZ4_LOTJA|nr:unknown [Lotus japonicus]
MLIWSVDLTADLIIPRHHLIIPDYIQEKVFNDMSPEINVLLPDGSWTR